MRAVFGTQAAHIPYALTQVAQRVSQVLSLFGGAVTANPAAPSPHSRDTEQRPRQSRPKEMIM
jgi:hypothetical protein